MNKEIEQLINEFSKKRYQEGYDDGYKDGAKSGYMTPYQEGLKDAWECFKKLVYPIKDGGFSTEKLREIFEMSLPSHIVRDFSPSEAIQKIKDYEEQQKQTEIRVGDEVYAFRDSEIKRVVIYINDAGDVADTALPSGFIMSCLIKDLTKTGKHYDAIDEVLKELRGDEE